MKSPQELLIALNDAVCSLPSLIKYGNAIRNKKDRRTLFVAKSEGGMTAGGNVGYRRLVCPRVATCPTSCNSFFGNFDRQGQGLRKSVTRQWSPQSFQSNINIQKNGYFFEIGTQPIPLRIRNSIETKARASCKEQQPQRRGCAHAAAEENCANA